ncbi:ribosomal protein L4 domain-containing protein [Phakopsora pachyrhizi]|uniref:Ribosomal protein L4 domain-containing protein n=1 Tax=Phakopsora pachyrhizi TaxID=170000 RepID=A0AAV0BJL2_PHAPC|nr:ribosomal protein L4 domain-containing protein [Phakopsora pachyrhizi]CAH7687506.1 ribosomal protein L4 domain-containing protein [Phakopsora pachyrhizi]
MASRPVVNVRSPSGESSSTIPLPAVFTAPIRNDVVQAIHKNLAKNKRQAYSVSSKAGGQTSAESWGTGRAVARIPRVGGGGTHRSGQAAFGNMCRGGRMFAPTKIWRRWHVKTNLKQRRYATVSAIAATAVPSLVLARGHRIEKIQEVPLVISDAVESVTKTREAVAILKTFKAYSDVVKVSNSRKTRAGKGKMRGRRYRQRRGPLVIFNEDKGISRAFRNLPGVEIVSVHRLNLLHLAPGGHIGRFCIWSESAFTQLDELYGTYDKPSTLKKDFTLPTPIVSNADITRVINSEEIQSIVKPAGPHRVKRPFTQKKNPLKNRAVLFRLNPYAKVLIRNETLKQKKNLAAAAAPGTAKKGTKKLVLAGEKFLTTLHAP